MTIELDLIKFKKLFSEFSDMDNEQIEFAWTGAITYISNKEGSISGWDIKNQTMALYLATAHLLWLSLNPQGKGGGNKQISSASEGSDSVSFTLNESKNSTEYFWNLSMYGLQLLVLFEMTAPPFIIKPLNDVYYRA